MKVLLDTSVVVTALVGELPAHSVARSYFDRARLGQVELVVATHALAEAYATLTALPLTPRVTPAQAERLLRESILPVVDAIALEAVDYAAAIERVAALGLSSGSIYDALHVRAGEVAGCSEVVTFNGRDFGRFPPAAPARLVVLQA